MVTYIKPKIVLLVPSWSEKGTRLKELDWPEKQTITPDEIKKVPSISEKGTMLLHKKIRYLISILIIVAEPLSLEHLMSVLHYSNKKTFRDNYLNPLIKVGFVEKTEPDNPKSPNQKYRLTEKGLHFLSTAKN
jgi:ATP-dependent DNA helicase RecG